MSIWFTKKCMERKLYLRIEKVLAYQQNLPPSFESLFHRQSFFIACFGITFSQRLLFGTKQQRIRFVRKYEPVTQI